MITTSNIYYAGYLLSADINIVNVQTAINNKQKRFVIFQFSTGDEQIDDKIDSLYNEHKVSVNLKQYLDSLEKARDIVHNLNRTIKEPSKKKTGTIIKNLKETSGEHHERIRKETHTA
jgi:hypothetical protein